MLHLSCSTTLITLLADTLQNPEVRKHWSSLQEQSCVCPVITRSVKETALSWQAAVAGCSLL